MGAPRNYPDELRERATRMALEALADPDRSRGAIVRIAEQLGVHREALRTWVRKAQAEGQDVSSVSTDRDARLAELEKENRELRRANTILSKPIRMGHTTVTRRLPPPSVQSRLSRAFKQPGEHHER